LGMLPLIGLAPSLYAVLHDVYTSYVRASHWQDNTRL
jgi:hypothetical protein